jgi:C-terminal processing protease CtpA/Prc
VSKGSHAEKFGIQRGDIIECINGKCISTTIEVGVLEIC